MTRRTRVWSSLAAVAALLAAVSVSQAAPVRTTQVERPAVKPGSGGAIFGCRAAVAPIYLGSATKPLLNTGVANEPTYPCVTASSTVQPVGLNLASLNLNLGTVGPAGAYTYETGQAGSVTAPAASAVANVQAVNLNLGTAGILTIVGPVQADASYECLNNRIASYGQSTLDVLYINGQKTTLPSPGSSTKITLGGGAYIAVNEKIQTATSLTENVLDVHLANGLQVIVGQAEVTAASATACANTAPTNGGVLNGFPNLCPAGTTIDYAVGACVIKLGNGQIIIVSKPFLGPTGGTVLALSVARKRYHSPCLHGSGPAWILVAKKVHGRVMGTPKSDRILGLGAFERIAGLAGNDCIDAQGKSSTVWDGNGKDRSYVHAGHNRVGDGNGNDLIVGGSGSVWITVGNGNSRVTGGQGPSRIDVGIGHNTVFGGMSNDRIWAGGDFSKVSCGGGTANVLFARIRAANYGRAHGCQRIVLLH